MNKRFLFKRLLAVTSVVSLSLCGCTFAWAVESRSPAPIPAANIHLDMSISDDGKTVYDVAGGHHATVTGILTQGQGPKGDETALGDFDKENYMSVSSPETMSFSDDFSVSVTFKVPSFGSEQMLVVKRDLDAGKREFQVFLTAAGEVDFIIRNAKNQWVHCTGPVVTADEWHTAVATVKEEVMQLYIDGILTATTVNTGGRHTSVDAPFGIGGDANKGMREGSMIADVIISDSAAVSAQLELDKEGMPTVATLQAGNAVFSNRNYIWADDIPNFFEGMDFNLGTINGGTYTVVTGGVLYALTPDSSQSGAASMEQELTELGFTRLKGLDFQAFGSSKINYVHAYCKQVEAGETFTLGKWAILVAEDMKINNIISDYVQDWANNDGEVLYNGITLPESWPPATMEEYGLDEMPVPYLTSKPEVININTGRQLFVDDFLIESTTLTRQWHKAEKYEGNPVMKPETAQELGRAIGNGTNYGAMAAPFSGGVWYDSEDELFKMWYCAGWHDGTALATSKDGITWERAEYDVEAGTNLVLPLSDSSNRDSAAVIYDPYTDDENARYKMFLWSRPQGGEVFTSADGIHWGESTPVAETGDRSTIFYNPFREKWVYSIRSGWANRSRSYSECDDLIAGATLAGEVKWARADNRDIADPTKNQTPALYNLDAVAYESVMLGAFTIYLGPSNEECYEVGIPKVTELHMGFSRDGFHWSRSEDRTAFIEATEEEGSWERGYLHSNAAVCLINDDELWFYYTGFEGDESKAGAAQYNSAANGAYSNASTGLATLRRDGFASMNAEDTVGMLTTEAVTFDGKYLFVNADAANGSIKAEILDVNGNVIEGYSADDCVAVTGDTTKAQLAFGKDLSSLSGQIVKFRFIVENAKLYSFWVTDDGLNGASGGYLAGGSIGQQGLVDTAASYAHEHQPLSQWQSNESEHWRNCATCGEKVENTVTAHVGGQATCTAVAVCAFCGRGYGEAAGHTMGPWKTVIGATYAKEGMKERRCTVCGELLECRSVPIEKGVDTLTIFEDIQKSDWFVKNGSIDYAYNMGFFKGATATAFEPNTPVTRGMFVTVLGRLHGVKEVKAATQFTDVKRSAYYSGFVAWAAKSGVVTGTTPTTFDPEASVTREQICAMMYRYCDYADISLKKINKAITFADAKDISGYAKRAVAACQRGAIVNGKGAGRFDPKGNATRAEVATILMNFCNNYVK